MEASDAYEVAAVDGRLFEMSPADCMPADPADLARVYVRTMARKKARGRPVYDRLMLAAPNGICPFCAQRDVGTLDHYLPKSVFPELAVTPVNLIPACASCNKLKDVYTPDEFEQQLLPPYFDDLTGVRWLFASVHENGGGAALKFFIQQSGDRPRELTLRVQNHFNRLHLGTLYSTHAAEELANIKHLLAGLRARGGQEEVRQFLLSQAESCSAADSNSWRTSTYFALHDNRRYIDGSIQ